MKMTRSPGQVVLRTEPSVQTLIFKRFKVEDRDGISFYYQRPDLYLVFNKGGHIS